MRTDCEGPTYYCDLCQKQVICTTSLSGISDNSEVIGGTFDIVSCTVCGHKFINPFPADPKEIEDYYVKNYYAHIPHGPVRSSKQKLKEMLRREYYGRHGSQIRTSLVGKVLYMFFRRTINEPPVLQNGRLLDVGCGNGEYIESIVRYGWTVSGLEPNARSVDCCIDAGLDVKMGPAEDIPWPDAAFDVVRIWNVLEHTFTPYKVLFEIRRVLKDKGYLLIHVPNYDSADRSQFKQHWANLEVPRHLHHFTRDTLVKYLQRADFAQVRDCYPGMLLSNLRGTKDLCKAAGIPGYQFWRKASAMILQKIAYRTAFRSYAKDVGITILAQLNK